MEASPYDLVLDPETVRRFFSEEGVPFEFPKLTQEKLAELSEFMTQFICETSPNIIEIPTAKFALLSELLCNEYEKCTKVSVIGQFNRGKTFVLNQLVESDFDTGNMVHTRGICFAVKSDSKRGLMAVDTAGTDVPLDKIAMDNEVKTFGEFEPKTLDPYERGLWDMMEVQRREQERSAEHAKYHQKLVTQAIVTKKSVELFLQKRIYQMSDMLIIVVNEMSWADQQYIEAIERTLAGDSKKKKLNLIVVHNYKDAQTLEEFNELKALYVTNVYLGDQQLIPTNKGDCTVHVRKTVRGDSNGARHVFLARHNTEAGNVLNQPTIEYLRTLGINMEKDRSDEPFLQFLVRHCAEGLSELVRDIGVLELCFNREKNQLCIRSQERSPDFIRSDVEITQDCRMILRDMNFACNYDSVCFPKVITVTTKSAWCVITVDVPGFADTFAERKAQKCELNWQCDQANRCITVYGHRNVHFRMPVIEDDAVEAGQYVIYDKALSEKAFLNTERANGQFCRIIPIPNNYRVPPTPELPYKIANGELTFWFAGIIPGGEDNFDVLEV